MFFDDYPDPRLKTTQGRHEHRKEVWRLLAVGRVKSHGIRFWLSDSYRLRYPLARYRFHWLLHNTIVHLLIAFFPCKTTFDLHDRSSKWLMGDHHAKRIMENGVIRRLPPPGDDPFAEPRE